MSVDLHALAGAVLELDPADRLALATLLIDSVEDAADPGWEASWTEELRRRSAAADARTGRGAPWAEVRARLLRDLSSR
jgi:putative addiction module component (TIGR02574 family)